MIACEGCSTYMIFSLGDSNELEVVSWLEMYNLSSTKGVLKMGCRV